LKAQKEAVKRRLDGHALAYVYFEENAKRWRAVGGRVELFTWRTRIV
jgi:hypothetical protein